MAQKVVLDAMIPREDFAVTEEEGFDLDLFRDFPLSYLAVDSPIIKLLRKPDFQRETNQWTPEQVAIFIASFVDNEVIPSLILWKSPKHVFVIDGGHRLSALRAWMEDDYGDAHISAAFYKSGLSLEQIKIAKRTRQLVEAKVGKYSHLKGLVGVDQTARPGSSKRANRMTVRALNLQWIQGNAEAAETSFYKINSQGTPLDDTEELLIKNRKKSIAIAARAILRAGTGHKYWSAFEESNRGKIEELAEHFNTQLFKPEAFSPLKTLDVPFGGAVSPVDALALLIELLSITSQQPETAVDVSKLEDDIDGSGTIAVMARSGRVLDRITGNSAGSLGLHPAVYFYNEKGKYNRFLFLGLCSLINKNLFSNNKNFFPQFTKNRFHIENFLITNKSIIGLALQNMSRGSRVKRMTALFDLLVNKGSELANLKFEDLMRQIGISGKILQVGEMTNATRFSDEAKSELYITAALKNALRCPICNGLLNPGSSVSYDHIKRVQDGGKGSTDNGQLVHPYCNTGIKC